MKSLTMKTAGTIAQYWIMFLLLLWLALSVFACSSEEADPTPAQARQDTQTETGCQATVSKNVHSNGVQLKIKAEFAGCHEQVVFEVKTDLSSYRQPSGCDVTEKAVSFASTGSVIKVGLYPCGGQASNSGASYTLTIENSGVVTKINAKVGNINLYTVK